MTGLTSRAVGPRPDRICGRVRTPWRVGASDALCAGSDSTAPVRGPPDRGASHEPQAMIPTPTLLTAMLKRDDADLSSLQQALATVCAQTGGKAGNRPRNGPHARAEAARRRRATVGRPGPSGTIARPAGRGRPLAVGRMRLPRSRAPDGARPPAGRSSVGKALGRRDPRQGRGGTPAHRRRARVRPLPVADLQGGRRAPDRHRDPAGYRALCGGKLARYRARSQRSMP